MDQRKASIELGCSLKRLRAWEKGQTIEGFPFETVKVVQEDTLEESEVFQTLRRRHNLTIDEIARRMDVCAWTVTKMLNGQSPSTKLKEFWTNYDDSQA